MKNTPLNDQEEPAADISGEEIQYRQALPMHGNYQVIICRDRQSCGTARFKPS